MGFLGFCCRNVSPLLAFFTLLFVASAATYIQLERRERWQMGNDGWQVAMRLGGGDIRSTQTGPGSSPPSCRWKCGRCSPCYPVHVPVQPGLREPMEYYPEAWRCKCGGNLFMP